MTQADDRAARLTAQLRANLKRRKEQARAARDEAPPVMEEPAERTVR